MKKILLLTLLLLIPTVHAQIIANSPPETWQFELQQEDSNIYTTISQINHTTLQITIDQKKNLPGNYRWHMALCKQTPTQINYYNEDTQGGFNNSQPIELNHDTLTNYGMPSTWCPQQQNQGHILFSNTNANQLPKTFRIHYTPDEEPITFYTGDSTEILLALAPFTVFTYPNAQTNVETSDGTIILIIRNDTNALSAYKSSDSGTTWNETIIDSASHSQAAAVINSTNGITIVARDFAVDDLVAYQSSDNGETWTQNILQTGNFQWQNPDLAIGSDNSIHLCINPSQYDGDGLKDRLYYMNWTTNNGWTGLITVNTDYNDDTDGCAIDVDSNNIPSIVAVGTDNNQVEIWNNGNWGNTAETLIFSNGSELMSFPDFLIDHNDVRHVVWRLDPNNEFGYANSTDGTSWTVRVLTQNIQQGFYPSITQTPNNVLYAMNEYNNGSGYMAYFMNSTDGVSWSQEYIAQQASSTVFSTFHKTGGKQNHHTNPSTTVLHTYFRNNSGAHIYYYRGLSIAPPPEGGGDTCTYTSGDWTIDCTDNCAPDATDLSGNNLIMTGSGFVYLNNPLTNIGTWSIHNGCTVYDYSNSII